MAVCCSRGCTVSYPNTGPEFKPDLEVPWLSRKALSSFENCMSFVTLFKATEREYNDYSLTIWLFVLD